LSNRSSEPARKGFDVLQRAFLIRVLLILAVLLAANTILSIFFGLLFPIGYFSDKSVPRMISDLTFVEGAAIFFLGALLAFHHSKVNLRVKALIVIGASMIAASVGFGMVASYL
jgi:hypothetical protein